MLYLLFLAILAAITLALIKWQPGGVFKSWREVYREYLASDEWQRKRYVVLKRDG